MGFYKVTLFVFLSATLSACSGSHHVPYIDSPEPDGSDVYDAGKKDAETGIADAQSEQMDSQAEATDEAQLPETSIEVGPEAQADVGVEAETGIADTGNDSKVEAGKDTGVADVAVEHQVESGVDAGLDADASHPIDSGSDSADALVEACVPQVENCANGVDDDCDGAIDCFDPECSTFAGCHNFGNCSPIPPTEVVGGCSWNTTNYAPAGLQKITSAFENSIIGITDSKAKFFTGINNTSWEEFTLPDVNITDPGPMISGGTARFFFVLNQASGSNVYQWDSSFHRIAQVQTQGYAVRTIIGYQSQAQFLGTNLTNTTDVVFFKWKDPSTVVTLSIGQLYAPQAFVPLKMFDMSLNSYAVGYEYDPSDPSNPAKQKGAMAHFNGSAWIKLPVDNRILELRDIYATSDCDVMVVGKSRDAQGVTLQRNGNAWDLKLYPQIDSADVVLKVDDPHQFRILGHQLVDGGERAMIGTDNGDMSASWNPIVTGYYQGVAMWFNDPYVWVAGNGATGAQLYLGGCN